MKKLDSWEIFQEIDSPTYLERLARNIKLEGYFGKVSSYKVEEDSKPYESIKNGSRTEVIFSAKTHRNLLNRS